MSKYILGISAYYHDSAAALIKDGEIIAAVQEERFTRIKNDASFPVNAIKYCLSIVDLTLKELDAIVYYEKPFIKFERIIETHLKFFPRGRKQFCQSMASWVSDKLFFKKKFHDDLNKVEAVNQNDYQLKFSEHHYSHAASAYFTSGFDNAIIITIDGVGEWATTSIFLAEGSQINLVEEIEFPDSLGLLYSSFTYFCGFKVNSGEYKLMGLAPYGNKESEEFKHYLKSIKNELISINDDGSFSLNQKYFNYCYNDKMINEQAWKKLFSLKRNETSEVSQQYCNLALAIQTVTEEVIIKIVKKSKIYGKSSNLCLSGGVALNCVANSKILMNNFFENIWIHPAAGDAGGAVGCALAYFFSTQEIKLPLKMKHAYWGPSYSIEQIQAALDKYNIKYNVLNESELIEIISQEIFADKIIGWFQGRGEWGPRALGNRSILANPLSSDMQKKLNLKIKYRESFRPFAPIVTEEDASKFFNISSNSPYMLFTADIKDELQKSNASQLSALSPSQKLKEVKSVLPAITHVDYSVRLQTVSIESNPKIHHLLKAFEIMSGFPVLINTSFNVRGEPIVLSPEDAIKCFFNTEIDILVLENIIIKKSNQGKVDLNLFKQTFTPD